MGHPAKHTVENHPYLDKLIAKLGKLAACEAIGLSGIETNGAVRLAYELAAKQVWMENHEPRGDSIYFLCKLPLPQREAFTSVAVALGAKLTEWRL